MPTLSTIFSDTVLKWKDYPPQDVLVAATRAFDRGNISGGLAVLKKNPDALKELDSNGQTLFEKYLRAGSILAPQLAAAFPDVVEARNETTKNTLLMRLAAEGNRPLFLQLAGMGADLHSRDDASNMVMHYAALAPGVDVMLEAVKLGCGKNPINNYGQTPLMFLSRGDKKPGVVGVYLSSGFKLDSTDNFRMNPTMHAISNLQLGIATDLMKAGGIVDFENTAVMVQGRALAHSQPSSAEKTSFMTTLTERFGAQQEEARLDEQADKARKNTAAVTATASVIEGIVKGSKRPPVARTVRFKKPGEA